MLVSFFRAAPKACFHGTCVEYMCDTLFVHLDDPSRGIQDAVFEVLKAASGIQPGVVKKKAAANRGRHRAPEFCDALVAFCDDAK